MSGIIGQDVSRVEGPGKVSGSARYSGEIALPDLAYAEIVGAGDGERPDHLDRYRAGGARRWASPGS